jgi:hypothetical protein
MTERPLRLKATIRNVRGLWRGYVNCYRAHEFANEQEAQAWLKEFTQLNPPPPPRQKKFAIVHRGYTR